jgi:diguanylate cyclase (GGDEF)-like protein
MRGRFWLNWRARASVSRRTLAVYVVSVLATFLLVAAVTYGSLRQDLETDAQARLLESARVYGLGVYSRITHADQVLERLAAAPVHGPGKSRPQLDPESALADVRFVRADAADGAPGQGDEQTQARQLAAVAEQTMRGNPLRDSTIELAHEGSDVLPVLVRQVPGADRLFAVGWIRPEYLWDSTRKLPDRMQLCVNGPRGSFRVCRPRGDEGASADADDSSQSRLTARWPLFLRAQYGVDEWSVEASQLQANILTPLSRLRAHAIPASAAAVLLGVLLGVLLIRRSFLPLERLLADWTEAGDKASGDSDKPSSELEQLSTFIATTGARLERRRCLIELLTELDRKILAAGSLQTTVLWLLPRIAAQVEARGVAAVFAANPEEEAGTLYLAASGGSPPTCSPCDISVQSIRTLLESDEGIDLSNLQDDLPDLAQSGFRSGRAYPIGDERHLVGALLLLDLHQVDADTDSQCLALADRVSVAVSHWQRKEELARAMHFDTLTGLANRELLLERLGHALAKSATGHMVAVVLIGFEGFEKINTTLGHRAGDQLLRLAASRIRAVVRETETLARVTGNELVLLVPELDEPASVGMAAQRITALFQKPFLADGLSYSVTVSIGIAVAPTDGITPEGLIRSAETAMRRAKGGSANRITYFEEAMNEHARRRIWLEHELRGAVGTRQLQIHFQPKVELATGRVTGAEALLRWMHPREGLIPPSEFIPTAEASGLIVPIGQWVLEESCRRLLEWRLADVHLDQIAINVSLRQLQDDSFLEYLSRYLEASGIEGHLLELEVTESTFAAQPTQLSRALERIRGHGVRIAIDDFGTGYSSLALLQVLPIDVLKIDRAFVSEIGSGTGDAIVKAIIALGLALGKDLVAEGVETEAQARALTQRGCRSAQGFLYAPALVADEFVRFVRDRRSLLEQGEPRARRA